MGRKRGCSSGDKGDFKQAFNDFRCACNNCFGFNGRRVRWNRVLFPWLPFWCTPGKLIVSSILFITLLLFGVGFYGIIIIILLLLLLIFV